MTSLYATLGIRRNASAARVKAAYRTLAKTAHPDAGGDAERFNAINLAYRILSDPEHRKRYDATGATDDEADNEIAEVLGVIDQVIEGVLMADDDPKHMDLVGALERHFMKQEHEMVGRIKAVERAQKRCLDMIGRFATTDGSENKIAALLRDRVKRCDAAMERQRRVIKLIGRVRVFLKGYAFRKEPVRQMSRGYTFGQAASDASASFAYAFGLGGRGSA